MIEKITNQNLERYDSRLKEWCDRKFFEKSSYGKYQTTEEAGIVAFYPAPNTPLEGKVKFSFKETMPANGEKGPDNPSTITGVSNINITRCGKNLIKLPFFSTSTSYTVNNVQFTLNHVSGTITVNGTSTDLAKLYFVGANSNILLASEKTYFMSGCPNNGDPSTYYIAAARYTKNNEYLSSLFSDFGTGQTWISNINCYFVSSAVIAKNATVSNLIFKPQLELGSFATSFEPYQGNDYTIQLGDTYYGGEIDLATGVMTVTYVICELNGTEWWSPLVYNSSTGYGWSYCIPSGITRYEPTLKINSVQDPSIVCCSHFITSPYGIGDMSINNGTMNYSAIFLAGAQCRFSFQYSDLADWKAYLAAQKTAGTPVKVAYLVDVPFTVQLTPAQILSLSQIDKYTSRLNTVYTDADSIQISYLKSPIRDEYEKIQAILSLGGNS